MWLLEFVFFLDRAASSVVPQRKIRNLKWELWVLLVRFSIRIKHRKRTYWITFTPLDWCIYSYSYTSMDLEGVLWQIEKYIHRLHHEESSKDAHSYILNSVTFGVCLRCSYYFLLLYICTYIHIYNLRLIRCRNRGEKKKKAARRKKNEWIFIYVGRRIEIYGKSIYRILDICLFVAFLPRSHARLLVCYEAALVCSVYDRKNKARLLYCVRNRIHTLIIIIIIIVMTSDGRVKLKRPSLWTMLKQVHIRIEMQRDSFSKW